MNQTFECPICLKKLRGSPSHIGRTINCPSCQNSFTAVDPNAPPAFPTGPPVFKAAPPSPSKKRTRTKSKLKKNRNSMRNQDLPWTVKTLRRACDITRGVMAVLFYLVVIVGFAGIGLGLIGGMIGGVAAGASGESGMIGGAIGLGFIVAIYSALMLLVSIVVGGMNMCLLLIEYNSR